MDAEADFDAFVRREQRRLLRAAWLLAGTWTEAQDLVQGVFEQAWLRWSALPSGAEREPYVRRMLVNNFLRQRRRKWTGELPSSAVPDEPTRDGEDQAAIRSDLMAAIRALPDRQRAVIALRYFADLTEAQTAEAMRCSVGAVKRHAARAVAALRKDTRIPLPPERVSTP